MSWVYFYPKSYFEKALPTVNGIDIGVAHFEYFRPQEPRSTQEAKTA